MFQGEEGEEMCRHKLPSEAVDAPQLEAFEGRLDGTPNLVLDLLVGNPTCGRGLEFADP